MEKTQEEARKENLLKAHGALAEALNKKPLPINEITTLTLTVKVLSGLLRT